MAFLLLLNTIARAFHLEIDNVLYNDIVMAVLGIVTVLGFVQKDGYEFTDQTQKDAESKNSVTNATQNSCCETEANNKNIVLPQITVSVPSACETGTCTVESNDKPNN